MIRFEMENLQNLLQQVSAIFAKHNEIAEISGEKFNVFQLLNVNHYENTHSSILSYFLNSKGNHGQKDLFLKLFLEVLNDKFLSLVDANNVKILSEDSYFHFIDKFKTRDSESITEYVAGKIDDDYLNGGRIDILLRDEFKKQIIIENKIYAVDQINQLVRYKNFDRNAPIFYLNLYGDEPSINSKGKLIENIDYYIISYETEIVFWLEKCIEECADKPFIRETLKQYLNLIKELTNQSTNKIMEKEITEVLIKDFPSFVKIVENQNSVFEKIISIFKQQLSEITSKYDVHFLEEFTLSSQKETGFYFETEFLKKNNLLISFEFNDNDYKNLNFGIVNKNSEPFFDEVSLKDIFLQKFKNLEKENNWIAWLPCHDCRDWSENSYQKFEEILNGKLIIKIEKKLSLILDVINELKNT